MKSRWMKYVHSSRVIQREEQSTTFGTGTQKYMAPGRCLLVWRCCLLLAEWRPKNNIIEIGSGKKAYITSSFVWLARKLIDECWNYESKDCPSFDKIFLLLEKNEIEFFKMSDNGIHEIQQFVQQHKLEIPHI